MKITLHMTENEQRRLSLQRDGHQITMTYGDHKEGDIEMNVSFDHLVELIGRNMRDQEIERLKGMGGTAYLNMHKI